MKEINLISRYLLALVDEPSGGRVKKGEYGLIKREDLCSVDFPSQPGYSASTGLTDSISYKLMPIGFDPNAKISKVINNYELY